MPPAIFEVDDSGISSLSPSESGIGEDTQKAKADFEEKTRQTSRTRLLADLRVQPKTPNLYSTPPIPRRSHRDGDHPLGATRRRPVVHEIPVLPSRSSLSASQMSDRSRRSLPVRRTVETAEHARRTKQVRFSRDPPQLIEPRPVSATKFRGPHHEEQRLSEVLATLEAPTMLRSASNEYQSLSGEGDQTSDGSNIDTTLSARIKLSDRVDDPVAEWPRSPVDKERKQRLDAATPWDFGDGDSDRINHDAGQDLEQVAIPSLGDSHIDGHEMERAQMDAVTKDQSTMNVFQRAQMYLDLEAEMSRNDPEARARLEASMQRMPSNPTLSEEVAQETHTLPSIVRQANSADPLARPDTENVSTTCSNCSTQVTPLRGYDPGRRPLCNDCGLFLNMHGAARPVDFGTVVQNLNRVSGIKMLDDFSPSSGPLAEQSVQIGDSASQHHALTCTSNPRIEIEHEGQSQTGEMQEPAGLTEAQREMLEDNVLRAATVDESQSPSVESSTKHLDDLGSQDTLPTRNSQGPPDNDTRPSSSRLLLLAGLKTPPNVAPRSPRSASLALPSSHVPAVPFTRPYEPYSTANLPTTALEKAKSGRQSKKRDHSAAAASDQATESSQPVYPKVHRDFISVETLRFYAVPYEDDASNTGYIIMLREMDQHEVEILLRHTARMKWLNEESPRGQDIIANRVSGDARPVTSKYHTQRPHAHGPVEGDRAPERASSVPLPRLVFSSGNLQDNVPGLQNSQAQTAPLRAQVGYMEDRRKSYGRNEPDYDSSADSSALDTRISPVFGPSTLVSDDLPHVNATTTAMMQLSAVEPADSRLAAPETARKRHVHQETGVQDTNAESVKSHTGTEVPGPDLQLDRDPPGAQDLSQDPLVDGEPLDDLDQRSLSTMSESLWGLAAEKQSDVTRRPTAGEITENISSQPLYHGSGGHAANHLSMQTRPYLDPLITVNPSDTSLHVEMRWSRFVASDLAFVRWKYPELSRMTIMHRLELLTDVVTAMSVVLIALDFGYHLMAKIHLALPLATIPFGLASAIFLLTRTSYFLENAFETIMPEPPLMAKMTRIRWRCACGRLLYDDFREIKPGAMRVLQRSLDHKRSHGASHGASGDPLSTVWRSVRDALLPHAGGKRPQLPQHNQQATPITQGSGTSVKAPSAPTDPPQFLLLCVPFKRHATKLAHVPTPEPVSDIEFFRLLRQRYTSLRGRFRRFFSLRTLAELRFVHFEVFRNDLADVRTYDVIPPDTQKDKYIYDPMPAEFVPPIGKNQLRHLYDHPEDADDQSVCFTRVPRKLHERLVAAPTVGSSEGWGICFIEGISWPKVCGFGLVGVLLSAAFGVLWTVLKDDIQGGFGVASFMLGVLALSVGALQGALEM